MITSQISIFLLLDLDFSLLLIHSTDRCCGEQAITYLIHSIHIQHSVTNMDSINSVYLALLKTKHRNI